MNRTILSLNDEWETPKEVYDFLCDKYKIKPILDVCATPQNKKCLMYYSLPFYDELDALKYDWSFDTWCNPPHSQTGDFVRKAWKEWQKHNINIIMIIPTNTMSSEYWHEWIEGYAEYHPIKKRIRFLLDGKPSKFPSRNAYVCVIWRKR